MHLVGVDIGFSERRRSNGIVVVRDGKLIRAERLSVSERDAALRELRDIDIVAIDAPLLPPGTAATFPRYCERVFSLGLFQKRCKPGMSHIRGTGQRLREHGQRAAEQLLVARSFRPSIQRFRHVWPDAPIVEAFPNAFLGVAVPDDDYLTATKIKRGGKFDWLYDRWIDRGLFPRIVSARPTFPSRSWPDAKRKRTTTFEPPSSACSRLHSPPPEPPKPLVRMLTATSSFLLGSSGRSGRRNHSTLTGCDMLRSSMRSHSLVNSASSPHAPRPDSC